MAPLERVVATAHPAGNRIDLSWANPDAVALPDVRLVRRLGTHPDTPEPGEPGEGVVVADTRPASSAQALIERGADGAYRVSDAGLQAEVVHYYALFPYAGDPPEFEVDRHNRTAAMATARNDLAGLMYELLPAIYRRYDTIVPRGIVDDLAETDREAGQLRRFLDLPGGQLDQLYSFTRALLDLYDLDRVDGRLLPLLAQWIGWKPDFRLGLATQRNEIRNAPALYQRIGILPVVASTVKRISGWECRPKELVHNVFATNRPERLNLWLARRDAGGVWSHGQVPLSLDFAYEGRPTAARDGEGRLHLFYATGKSGLPRLWTKTLTPGAGWSPSEPQPTGTEGEALDRHPAIVHQGDSLWLFWESRDPVTGRWRVRFQCSEAGGWGPVETLGDESTPERRRPTAAADDAGGFWLFYQERGAAGWEARYNRHDGAGWDLPSGALLPPDGGEAPRVESDPFVVVRPGATDRRLWLFWARKEPLADPSQSRWSVAYRVKDGLDPADDTDWGPVRVLPKDDPEVHDREPVALVSASGDLELFWASTRDGSWSIWRADLAATTGDPGAAEAVTGPPWSQRAPLVAADGDELLLLSRSNRSVAYTSSMYGAMRTLDGRYAGSTTIHVRNSTKLALRRSYDDFQTYTYDIGTDGERGDDDWYARDTLGLYLAPDTLNEKAFAASAKRLRGVLSEFIPATDRTVLIRMEGP